MSRFLLLVCVLLLATDMASSLAAGPGEGKRISDLNSRRAFLSNAAAASCFAIPGIAKARYVLNEETGDYDEVEDDDWQTAWGKRLDKAKMMKTDEIFLAAQGAGNLDLKEGEESDASKKRRALAGCRNDSLRQKAGIKDAKECTAKVLGGDFQFMIDVM